jgi:cysteine synthase A
MWSWFKNQNLETNDGDSFAEGIGQGRVTKNLEGLEIDEAYRVEDQAAFTIIHNLRREEGIFLGLSSGINIAGAVRYARQRGAGQTIVTILCDSGHKYIPRLYNPEWYRANNLRTDLPLESLP